MRERREREEKGERESCCFFSFLSSSLFSLISLLFSYLERVIIVKVQAGPGPRGRVDRPVRVVGPVEEERRKNERRLRSSFFFFFFPYSEDVKPIRSIVPFFLSVALPSSTPPDRSREVFPFWTSGKELESGDAQQVEERGEHLVSNCFFFFDERCRTKSLHRVHCSL